MKVLSSYAACVKGSTSGNDDAQAGKIRGAHAFSSVVIFDEMMYTFS